MTERARVVLRCLVWLGLVGGCGNDAATELAPSPSTGNAGTGAAPSAPLGGAAGRSSAPAGTGSTATGSAGTGSNGSAGTRAAAGSGGAAAAGSGGSAAGRSSAAGSGGAAGSATAGSASPAAGSGGMAAAGSGGSGAGGAGSPSEGAAKPPCLAKPSQLVVVGDSYLNWITHTFPDDFKKELGGLEYRMYAVGGSSMASGGIAGFIPDQLAQAIADDPDIIATVMTGGGNDILIADTLMYPGSDACKDRTDAPTVKVCQDVIAAAMSKAKETMMTAANAGIEDVIYIFYPHIPGGGFGGMNPNYILDYSQPLARDLCGSAGEFTDGKLRCHFLDLVPVFEGQTTWFADDGIHENAMGSAQIAKAAVQVMKDECIAQPADSGCCAP